MSERVERFEIDGRPNVSLRLPGADIRVVPSIDGAVVIRLSGSERDIERFRVEQNGRHVSVESDRERGFRIRLSSLDVEIAVPDGAELSVRLASGELRVEPELSSLSVDTASGDVAVEGNVTGDLSLKLASGDVRAHDVEGRVEASLASGGIVVRRIGGDCRIVAASGDVRVGRIDGRASFKSASGDVHVDRFGGDQFDAKSMSGDVVIGVPPGRRFEVSFKTLSGDVRTDFPVSAESSGGTARLAVTSMSGDITVKAVD
jgi:DUF4097 and DUF4098 domain-containing protein YvlB